MTTLLPLIPSALFCDEPTPISKVPVRFLLDAQMQLPSTAVASLLPNGAVPGVDDPVALLKWAEFLRVRLLDDVLVFYVMDIEWRGPHEPDGVWHPVTVLPASASLDVIGRQFKKLLRRRSYFVVCAECNEFNAAGHTNEGICHSCHTKNHGVVY
ncbi:hypothetical protein [Comamonas terrigena]|uniref:hypothetical protein n=1 Tax=Comamonas terrigena TaxID=32013 RepID=UPI00289F58A5|nr:hypothetical protein [Comamonas terrigena]